MSAQAPRGDCAPRPAARLRRRPHALRGAALATPVATASGRALASGAAAFVLCFGYAFVRYVVLKGEPFASVPLYVTNKAVALFALVLIAAAAARPRASWRHAARAAGLVAAVLHGLASVVLLRPAYLPKLHAAGGRLTGSAELAVLCGAATLVAFLALAVARPGARPPLRARWFVRGALAVAAVHCAALGAKGWVEPARWPGGLPPLTLLGSLAATVGLAAALLVGRQRAAVRTPAAEARTLRARR